MRVFARYISEDGRNFRLNTVLQFGNSWSPIGAAVLINPGSAQPINRVSDAEQCHLSQISGNNNDWFEFLPDPTMRQIEKIFNGWYVGEEKSLNGVILLYNLFNLQDQKLANALNKQKTCKSEHLLISTKDMEIIKDVDKIYLGWGKVGKRDAKLKHIAESIFSSLYPQLKHYLCENFDDNTFYHPGYINRSYKRNLTTLELMKAFNN